MQNNVQRLLPEAIQLKGFSPVSEPVELRVQTGDSGMSFQNEKDMLALADSLNKFANGISSIDRALRIQADNQAREIYLSQEDKNKREWSKITKDVPFASRLNPYTKDYYNNLVAEKIAQDNISQMQLDYTKNQIATKSPDEVKEFFNVYKQNLSKDLENEGLAPRNAIKAVEAFEIAKTAATREYIPANAEYNYKKGLGLFREKLTSSLLNLDLSKMQASDKIQSITAAISKETSEATANGVISEDIAEQIGNSLFNYITTTLDDDTALLDEAELLQALKNVKIDGRTLNELIPNFDVQIKSYIDKAYDGTINKAMRASRMEEARTKNAFVMGSMELTNYIDTLSGDPNSYENSQKIKSFIETLSSKDPYYKRNKADYYQLAFNQNKVIEAFNDNYSNKGLVADYLKNATFNPNGISLENLYNDYMSGKIDGSSYKSILTSIDQSQKGDLDIDSRLLTKVYDDQIQILKRMDNLDPEFQQDIINKINTEFITAYRGLNSPTFKNPNAFNEYQRRYNEITLDIDKKNAEYVRLKKADKLIRDLNLKLDKTQPIPKQGMFKTTYQYSQGLQVYNINDKNFNAHVYRANEDVSNLLNRSVSVTSPYGKARSNGKKHGGVDYAAANDMLGKTTLVVNVMGRGKVQTGYDKQSGNFARVTMLENPDCAYYVMHLSRFVPDLRNGMIINANTPLGYMGNTGHVIGSNGSDGTHTHVQYTYKGKVVSEWEWRKHLGI